MEPVLFKIFTSLLRDKVFNFLNNNKYIETSIHEGLTLGLGGTFEHIVNMSHIINDTRHRQSSVTTTLIELIHLNWIKTVLKYHYIPDGVIRLNPTNLFPIPDWIPKFNSPSVEFDLSSLMYSKICKIVKRMKVSGLPCLFD